MEATTVVSLIVLAVTVANGLLLLRLNQRIEHSRWKREQRLPVYRDVLAAGLTIADTETGLRMALMSLARDPELLQLIEHETEARRRHNEAMEMFSRAAAEAMLIGPREVREATVRWLMLHGSHDIEEAAESSPEQWLGQMNDLADARASFEKAARNDLDLTD